MLKTNQFNGFGCWLLRLQLNLQQLLFSRFWYLQLLSKKWPITSCFTTSTTFHMSLILKAGEAYFSYFHPLLQNYKITSMMSSHPSMKISSACISETWYTWKNKTISITSRRLPNLAWIICLTKTQINQHPSYCQIVEPGLRDLSSTFS